MSDLSGIHCYVSGHVQGVWFRASTREQALQRGLTGWARNLPDGRVELMAFGERKLLAELHEWLKIGPPLAKVGEVISEEVPWKLYDQFKVL